MNEDFLYVDVVLVRLIEGFKDNVIDCIFEVGIWFDDICGVVIKFEDNFFFFCLCF